VASWETGLARRVTLPQPSGYAELEDWARALVLALEEDVELPATQLKAVLSDEVPPHVEKGVLLYKIDSEMIYSDGTEWLTVATTGDTWLLAWFLGLQDEPVP
jgi:hypothetical protein